MFARKTTHYVGMIGLVVIVVISLFPPFGKGENH